MKSRWSLGILKEEPKIHADVFLWGREDWTVASGFRQLDLPFSLV